MAKDLLDFSKFRKIFEDDKNTHLQHPKGHTIIVAHVALTPKLKKQIADLPLHNPKKMMEHALEMAEDVVEGMPRHKMAEGGEAKPFHGYNPEKHSRTGGLNDAYREKYNREHGSHLKRPVTGHPEPGSEAAGRKKSFCARMKGVKGPTSEGGELTPKGAALKRWNCHAHGGMIEDTDHDHECVHYAEGGEAKPSVNRLNMHYKDVTKRVPQLTEGANKIAAGKMSAAEYDALVNKHKPVEAYGFVPQPASREDAMRALNESKRKMYGMTHEMTPGEPADLRLDIPAYKEHGVWVNSIHRKDAPTVYGSVSSVNNAQMVPSSEKALRVAAGGPKAPFAVIRGEWNPMEEQEAVEKAQKFLKHKDWKQVGYDPERHGYFYDRETMQPIEGAEQVIQIGPLVLAKKPRYGKKHEQLFAKGGDVQDDEVLTSRGEPLSIKEGLKAPEWEFGESPVLHTKKGSIPLKFPKKSDSTYQDILRSKELNEPHEEAMGQWLPRNKALQEGKPLSSRTVGLNNLMSILSANTATPQMELSFSRLLDASRKLGIDPRSPEFAEAIQPGGKVYKLWEQMDSPESFPEQGREYFEGPAREAFIQKGESKVTGRKPGDIVSTSPSRKTFAKRLSNFPASIQYYTRLANKHGADAVAYAEELARDKVRAEAHAAKAERLQKKGEQAPEFEGDKGALAPVGLGTKTNLFAHEMSGAGNSMIPDTHILRSIFGLDVRNPGDAATLEHIKNTLLSPQNYHLLKQLNEHYQKEHPAHEYAAEKYGLGKGNPQATFPAHWLHWNTVSPYERAQGIGRPSTARNLTTHGNIFKALNEPHEYMADGGQVRHYANAGEVTPSPVIETDEQVKKVRDALNALPSFDRQDLGGEEEEEPQQPVQAQGPRTHYAAPLPGMTGAPVYDEDEEQQPQAQQPQAQPPQAQQKKNGSFEYPGVARKFTPEEQMYQQQQDQDKQREEQVASLKDQFQKRIQHFYNSRISRANSVYDEFHAGDTGDMFGANGEFPSNFDADTYKLGEQDAVRELQEQNAKKQAQQQWAEQENIVRARAGGAPLPTGQAPIGMARPAPSPAGAPPAPSAGAGQPPAGMGNLPENVGKAPQGAPSFSTTSYAGEPTVPEFGTQTPEQLAVDSYNREADALRRKKDIASGIAQANIDIERKSRQSQEKVSNLLISQLQQEQANNDAWAKAYLNEKIDPMKAWTDKSVPGKIATILGILVGGFATGREGVGENPALKVLQYQLDKEIEAQKTRLARYPEVMKMGRERLTTVQNAALTLKAQYGEVAARQLAEKAAQYGVDASNAEFQKAMAALQQKYISGPLGMIAFNKLSTNPNLSDEDAVNMITQARGFNPEYGNQLADKYLVGYGFSLSPLNRDVARQVLNFDVFEKQALYLMNLVDAYKAGKYYPSAEKTEIATIAKALMKDLAHANAMDMTEGSAKWLKDQIGDPTTLWNNFVTDNAALKATLDDLNTRKASALRALEYPESSITIMMKKAQFKNKMDAMNRSVMHLEPLTEYAPPVPPVPRAQVAPGAMPGAPVQGQPNNSVLDFRPKSP